MVDPIPGAGAPHLPQQPDLVQLLTPEGERVEHPDYTVDFTDDELARSTATSSLVRRWTPRRPRCSGRASWASGPACSARRRPRSAPAGRCAPQDMAFPTYREHGVPDCRGIDPIMPFGLFRGVDQGGWDPDEPRVQPVHDRHRRADAARHRLRHGHRRTARSARGRRGASSPTSATAPPARATSTRRSSGPASSTRRSSSSARTTSTRSASRSSARRASRLPPRRRLRLPRRAGRRQRRAGRPTR